jgi:HSP90 family molecular chaperone
MVYKEYTYKELENQYNELMSQRSSIMSECAKNGLSFNDFIEKAKDVSEEIFYISKEMRLKQNPIMEYGKVWNGVTLTIEQFINECNNGMFTDDSCNAYYATDNAKSNILAKPSDFIYDYYRKDFTHVIVF